MNFLSSTNALGAWTRSFFSLAVTSLVFAGSFAGSPLLAEDWPQFRGADARGVVDGPASPPSTWSDTENVLWKVPVPGRGWSSPVVIGNEIFLTTVTQRNGKPEEAKPGLYAGGERDKPTEEILEWKVVGLDLDSGKTKWEKTLHQGQPKTSRHLKNSYASETPVSDGEFLYVLFGNVGCYCLTLEGDLVWVREIAPTKTRNDWGTASSPVLHNGKLYLVNDNDDQSYMLCLDARSGEEEWQIERNEGTNWSTPFIWENELRTEIVTLGSDKVRSYDLDGKLLYELSGFSSITIATPYEADGLLYISSGYIADSNRPVYAIRPGASGDITLAEDNTSNEFIVWSQPQGAPYNPSTLVYQGQLYVLYDRGIFASYDAKTGEVIYERKRLNGGRSFTASPWAYDGKVFCLSEFGETFVIKAGPEFELLGTNQLTSEELCMATPAIVGDRLILRTGDAVVCIGRK